MKKDTVCDEATPAESQHSQQPRRVQHFQRSAGPSLYKWRAFTRPLPARAAELDPADALEIRIAAAFAERTDQPLNVFVTIDWYLAPSSPATAAERFNAFRRRLLPQLRRWAAAGGEDGAAAQLAYVGVHEAPEGRLHTHLALHLPTNIMPPQREMETTLRRLAFGRQRVSAKALKAKPIHDLDRLLAYLSKGVAQEHYDAFAVRPAWQAPQGEVIGKRIAVSTATLGAATRARWEAAQQARAEMKEQVCILAEKLAAGTGASSASRYPERAEQLVPQEPLPSRTAGDERSQTRAADCDAHNGAEGRSGPIGEAADLHRQLVSPTGAKAESRRRT